MPFGFSYLSFFYESEEAKSPEIRGTPLDQKLKKITIKPAVENNSCNLENQELADIFAAKTTTTTARMITIY